MVQGLSAADSENDTDYSKRNDANGQAHGNQDTDELESGTSSRRVSIREREREREICEGKCLHEEEDVRRRKDEVVFHFYDRDGVREQFAPKATWCRRLLAAKPWPKQLP
jgi:hypothetical protein